MASFDTPVAPMQPNSYLSSYSQGTDRASLQPLAEVPKLSEKYVSPDYKANTTGGQALSDVGKLETLGVDLADGVIKQNIDDNLNSGINKIRDSFGVAQATNIGSGFADAVGQGGNETSLTGATGQTPTVLKKLGTQVDGLTEAYNQGQLSNSAYYAKMNAYVTQVKQQFPGYSDEVDQMAASKLGVNPANALRSAIQDDVTKLAAKVNAANDKWTTYETSKAGYIHTKWPQYEQMKQDGTAPSQAEVRNVVGNLEARDLSVASRTAALAADKSTNAAIADKANDIIAQKASDLASHLTVGLTNSMGIKNASDFNQVLEDIRSGKRPLPTPDEKAQLSGIVATMKQQYGINFDSFVNATQDAHGLPQRPIASYTTPDALAARRAQGMQPILDQEAGLIDGKMGILAQSANWNQASLDAGESDFIRRAPIAATAAAGRKFFGDDGAMMLTMNEPFIRNASLEPYRQYNQGAMAQGNSSLTQVLGSYKDNKVNDGELNHATIADTVSTILHPEKTAAGKDVAGPAAVQHAFGPNNRTLLDAFNTKDQVAVFGQLTSKPLVDKISKMDGASKGTFTNWVDDSFTGIYKDQVDNANQAQRNFASNASIKVVYDPKTANFSFEPDGVLSNAVAGVTGMRKGVLAQANAQLTGLNTAINSMKEVFKLEGKDPTQALYNLLPAAGIDPGTPIYKALQETQKKEEKS